MMTMFDTSDLATSREPRGTSRLLGGIDVRCAGMRVDAHLSSQSLLVLAILIAHGGRTLRREDIAFRLWPDLSEADARTTLRRNLYTIAQSLPAAPSPWMHCDKKTVTWAPAGDVYCDVLEFEALGDDLPGRQRAAELYRGDFAPQLDHEWPTGIGAHLRRDAIRALEGLVAHYGSGNDDRACLRYANQLLDVDPWREDVFVQAMMLRYRLGDRAGAMHDFGLFRIRLRRELGVEPMPETLACYNAIGAGSRELLVA